MLRGRPTEALAPTPLPLYEVVSVITGPLLMPGVTSGVWERDNKYYVRYPVGPFRKNEQL